MSASSVHVQLQQKQDYQFDIHFDEGIPVLRGDWVRARNKPEQVHCGADCWH